jgi:hypothetical protein
MKKFLSVCALFALSTVMALAADISGTWKGEANPNGKGGPPTFTLKQSGSVLTGTTTGRGGEIEISNGKVDGDKVYFEVTRDMGEKGKFTTKYTGSVSGTTMTLSMDNGRGQPRDITLTKQ